MVSRAEQEHALTMLVARSTSRKRSKKLVILPQPIGDLGQVALQHVVKAVKQEQERVLTTLLVSLMSQKLAKQLALLPQLTGVHGQAVQKPAIVVSREEQEHALIIVQAPPMSRKLTKKHATTSTHGKHGQPGVSMIHAKIGVPVHINNNVQGNGMFKYPHVRMVKRLNTNIKHKIVVIQAIGEKVR